MLRAALAGSTLVDGEVRGRTPYLSRLLHGRYAREVEKLIASVVADTNLDDAVQDTTAV